jgi:hypothetical protein
VLGLGGLPSPGDLFQALADAAKARQVAQYRQMQARDKAHAAKGARLTLESFQAQLAEGGMKELPLIIKADVQGSAEVLGDTLTKLSDDRVKIRIIHSGVGAINESDVLLAAASNAIVIGFNVRPDRNAADVADRDKVDIRLHSVIYKRRRRDEEGDDGPPGPDAEGSAHGSAEVRDTFKTPKFGTTAGCMVTEGRIARSGDTRWRGCATTWSSTKGASARCEASRTTSRRSRPASSAASASRSSTTSRWETPSKPSWSSASPQRCRWATVRNVSPTPSATSCRGSSRARCTTPASGSSR